MTAMTMIRVATPSMMPRNEKMAMTEMKPSLRRPPLEFDGAGRQSARPDDELPGQTDQIHIGKLCPRPLVAIVIEDLDLGGGEPAIDFGAFGVRRPVIA